MVRAESANFPFRIHFWLRLHLAKFFLTPSSENIDRLRPVYSHCIPPFNSILKRLKDNGFRIGWQKVLRVLQSAQQNFWHHNTKCIHTFPGPFLSQEPLLRGQLLHMAGQVYFWPSRHFSTSFTSKMLHSYWKSSHHEWRSWINLRKGSKTFLQC